MEDREIFLDKIHIINFLSLRDVELSLKPLTILVGPNASGKSNVLNALGLLNNMLEEEELPPLLADENFQKAIWAGGADKIRFELTIKANQKLAQYKLEFNTKGRNRIALEELIVDQIKVITVEEGEGKVTDEDNGNTQAFHSKKLALKSAGDYGDKPITKKLAQFIRDWGFYDFRPNQIRKGKLAADIVRQTTISNLPTQMDSDGEALGFLLYNWSEQTNERFKLVSESLYDFCKLSLGHSNDELFLLEGHEKPIPLEMASDGILRFLAYQALLVELEIPSLITIEEPERNLHPVALTSLAHLLKRLSQKTQVVLTTHSSQLLDAFATDELSDNLRVLLLQNKPGSGTEIINLEKVQEDDEALHGWIEDFGIGSAIFDSELLQDVLEG